MPESFLLQELAVTMCSRHAARLLPLSVQAQREDDHCQICSLPDTDFLSFGLLGDPYLLVNA